MEEGKTLEGFPNYIVYPDGKIWSFCIEDWLTPSVNKKGYPCVKLSGTHRKRAFLVHCLVAILYIPNSDPETHNYGKP